jgi:hypothetical protein
VEFPSKRRDTIYQLASEMRQARQASGMRDWGLVKCELHKREGRCGRHSKLDDDWNHMYLGGASLSR